MKILFYIHGITGGGGERVLSVLVNEFVKRNYSVSLATNLEIPFVYKIDNKVKLLNLYEGLQKKPSFLRPFFCVIIYVNMPKLNGQILLLRSCLL